MMTRLTIGVLVVTMMTSATSATAEENVLTEQECRDGWRLLFDGRSTDGWMTPGRKPIPQSHVQDGALNPHPCDYMLVYERPVGDFLLALDFKISPKCNSGVFVRTSSLTARPGKDVGFNGIEIAIDDTQTPGFHDTGAIYDLVKPKVNAMKPVGDWNHLEVRCERNIIAVKLNGESVTRMNLDDWKKPNRRPGGSEHKFDIAYRDHPRVGYIGLQDHGSDCWFRNIKLRPLDAGRVYGEWRIRVRPDQGPAYEHLIERSGLPLFRGAGARMVGWWKTLVGDLYEHVTIWEYDDMPAFGHAVRSLSESPDFARFASARDPLLDGEESRFLRPVAGAIPPALPEPAAFVVHEVHRVPMAHLEAYLAFMTGTGLRMLDAHDLRPVGPWTVEVGESTEVTYLFRFDDLAERDRRIEAFARTDDGRAYRSKLRALTEDVTTRLLIPASFALPKAEPKTSAARLPHHEELAHGVHAAGFDHAHGSSNCGWVALDEETLLIDVPRGIAVPAFLKLVAETTGKPVRTLVLTGFRKGDGAIVKALRDRGLTRLVASPLTLEAMRAEPGAVNGLETQVPIGVRFLPMDGVAGQAGGVVSVADGSVLFGGPLVIHGPRTPLPGSDTGRWVEALRKLEATSPAHVVPGAGSWGGPEVLHRQRRYLDELRRQVGYLIAQARPLDAIHEQVSLPAGYFAWMPYDTPTVADIDHVYRELTVPVAPFHGRVPAASDRRTHALVLIGDGPHEPGHIEEGLRPVFAAVGVVPHFTVDVNALTAANLSKVKLLVILRDGLQRPGPSASENYIWMTPEQQQAIVNFVESGGGFLNLHNSMGLYPDDSAYLHLVGGRYTGHGPLERFAVEVVDAGHPITKGVTGFFVADEQHTPIPDEGQVHLLLRSRSDDGKTVAPGGWTREPGRGRVCHLANGHTRESLLHPMVQRLYRNAVVWCARLDDRKE